jgi:hypothetical protein
MSDQEKVYCNSLFPGGLNRTQAVLIVVAAALDELRDKGVVVDGQRMTTAKTQDAVRELDRIGFEPTIDEMRDAFVALAEVYGNDA